ncbi:amino acid ABC transporter permease [Aminobacter anthyllidis]|uniref:amino acid ABC transporter permease n=1 Tax=Aminobacter anthyllidis TaxID=1035067 RepID=UPI00245527D2|nr:amino acid ABC transporter permease [Aminobacter anthyllidis]MDH4987936.1 amino acid ABC transporter permease [Aminobacter anthyllidis]
MTFDLTLFLSALQSTAMLKGAGVAILLSAVVQFVSFLLCLPVALALNSPKRGRNLAAQSYVWLFRASPLILVLLIVWNGAPQLIPALLKANWYTPFVAAAISFTLVTAAYMAEVMRGALRAIGPGQMDAAKALGLTNAQSFFLVILPQALRIALPSLVNEFINLIKLTSLAYVISLREIMAVVNDAIAASFRFVEWYCAALVYYLVIVSILMVIQGLIQRRLG